MLQRYGGFGTDGDGTLVIYVHDGGSMMRVAVAVAVTTLSDGSTGNEFICRALQCNHKREQLTCEHARSAASFHAKFYHVGIDPAFGPDRTFISAWTPTRSDSEDALQERLRRVQEETQQEGRQRHDHEQARREREERDNWQRRQWERESQGWVRSHVVRFDGLDGGSAPPPPPPPEPPAVIEITITATKREIRLVD